jgi:hypothetical protein
VQQRQRLEEVKLQSRYVDDVAHISFLLCARCVEASAKAEYPAVPFEMQKTETYGVPWLDVVLQQHPGSVAGVRVAYKPVEVPWICRKQHEPSKFRLPPYLGAEHTDMVLIRGLLRGRLARVKTAPTRPPGFAPSTVQRVVLVDTQ